MVIHFVVDFEVVVLGIFLMDSCFECRFNKGIIKKIIDVMDLGIFCGDSLRSGFRCSRIGNIFG